MLAFHRFGAEDIQCPDDGCRIFAVFYTIFGSSLIAAALAIFAGRAISKKDDYLEAGMEAVKAEEASDMKASKRAELSRSRANSDGKATSQSTKPPGASIYQPHRVQTKRTVRDWVASNWDTIQIGILFTIWIAAGVVYGMVHEGWTFITSLYFATTALSTGGLMAPSTGRPSFVVYPFSSLLWAHS